MVDKTHEMDGPTKGIWRRFLVLIPLAIALGVVSYLYIRSHAGCYTASGNIVYTKEEIRSGEVTFTKPGVVEVVSIDQTYFGTAQVQFRALSDGMTEASFMVGSSSDIWVMEVHNGAIVEGRINFEGWQAIQISAYVLLVVATALFASVYVQLWRISWYGYTMVASGGGFLFCLFQTLLFLIFLLFEPEPTFSHFIYDFKYMASYFAALTVFPMCVLSVLVSLSNIALIRHEGRRLVNVLGIVASALWGIVIVVWLLSGSLMFQVVRSMVMLAYLDALMALAISFGECLLLSTMVSAWLAARHVPRHGMDYLVVLGCGIRSDGTPCPLLAGRVDRAVDFDAMRVAEGDAPAVFVPSGGQGPDEPISEAQSMGTYLETQRGVPRERIVLEDRSTTTRENMAFSRAVIERHANRDASELRIGFSTTNYHVFRGYVCAHQAGMAVEGMGSKTKYYFWPNAFLREFVGLLANQWKSILLVFMIISVFYLGANYILTII